MTGTYANYKKVHTIDFEGKYFKSPRPAEHCAITAIPTDERAGGRVAAGTRAGRAARRHDRRACQGVEAMKAYRDRHPCPDEGQRSRSRALQAALPRHPPIVADTHEEALAKQERWFTRPALRRIHARRDLLHHRDRLRPSSIWTSRCRRTCRRTASAAPLRASWQGQGQDAARDRHRQRSFRQRPVRRHTRRGGR